MRAVSLPLMIVSLSLVIANQANASPRIECQTANIRSLHTTGLSHFIESSDYCNEILYPALPEPISNLLGFLGKVNSQVSALLKIKSEELFGDGLQIRIDQDPFGFLGSNADELDVGLTVYGDWNGEEIDPGVYAHELGHAIKSRNVTSPAMTIIRSLRENPLFRETFSDFLSMSLFGSIMAETLHESCESKMRAVNSIQSYDYPVSYFEVDFGKRRINQCCDYLKSINATDEFTRVTCAEVASDSFFDKKKIPPFDRRKMSEMEDYSQLDLDQHQIGLPFNSFLKNISKASQYYYGKPLLDLISQESLNTLTRAVKCKLSSYPGQPEWTTFILSPQKFFQLVRRNSEAIAGVDTVNRLWKKHRIDIAEKIAQKTSESSTDDLISEAFNETFPDHICRYQLDGSSNVAQCKKECQN